MHTMYSPMRRASATFTKTCRDDECVFRLVHTLRVLFMEYVKFGVRNDRVHDHTYNSRVTTDWIFSGCESYRAMMLSNLNIEDFALQYHDIH
jgi:hypothetical protein